MITLPAFIVAIALLVVVHEFGHYWAARRCGVKVLRFSVGFGKPLYIKKFAGSDTEWAISAIPLGGYVKMLDEREAPVAAEEQGQAFNRKPVWQRMIIVVAGPLANLLLAILLYWALFLHGVPGIKPVLGDIPAQSAAASAGFQTGETLLEIEGRPVPSWQELHWMLLDAAMQGGSVEVLGMRANGATLVHRLDMSSISPADLEGDFLGKLGLQLRQPVVAAIVGRVIEGGAAQRAGLQEQDRITAVNGLPLQKWSEFVDVVRSNPGSLLRVQVERSGSRVEIELTPELVAESGAAVGKIGVAPYVARSEIEAMMVEVRYGVMDALAHGARKTWETAVFSVKMMGEMIMGQVSLKNLSGPITIADYAGQSAQMGLAAYLSFLALISISIGVLNLMPVPLLDGGHLMYYTVELLKGSPVSDTAWEIGQRVGIALLITLMAFALYNDISRLILG